jgi:hypothetical protein
MTQMTQIFANNLIIDLRSFALFVLFAFRITWFLFQIETFDKNFLFEKEIRKAGEGALPAP